MWVEMQKQQQTIVAVVLATIMSGALLCNRGAEAAPQSATPAPLPIEIASESVGRLKAGNTDILVDAHGLCRWLDNTSASDYLVPLATNDEWLAFLTHAPIGVQRDSCCPARVMSLAASDGQRTDIALPVGRDRTGGNGSRIVAEQTFNISREDCTTHCDGSISCNTNTGIEVVRQEFECADGGWRYGASSSTGGAAYNPPAYEECYSPPPPPACGTNTVCEGPHLVTRDCALAIVGVEHNSGQCREPSAPEEGGASVSPPAPPAPPATCTIWHPIGWGGDTSCLEFAGSTYSSTMSVGETATFGAGYCPSGDQCNGAITLHCGPSGLDTLYESCSRGLAY